VSVDGSEVVASRFLAAAAVCVMLLSFAAERRKSYWSGRIKVAMVICQQIFLHFGADDLFSLKNPFQTCFRICFGAQIPFWSCNFCIKASLCRRFSVSAKASVCKSVCV